MNETMFARSGRLVLAPARRSESFQYQDFRVVFPRPWMDVVSGYQ